MLFRVSLRTLSFAPKLAATALVAASLVTTSIAGAQSFTFDNSSSIANGRNFAPPPVGLAFDYGGFTPSLTATSGWSGAEDHTGNSGGSAMLSWSFDASDGGASAAFTFDLFPTAVSTCSPPPSPPPTSPSG